MKSILLLLLFAIVAANASTWSQCSVPNCVVPTFSNGYFQPSMVRYGDSSVQMIKRFQTQLVNCAPNYEGGSFGGPAASSSSSCYFQTGGYGPTSVSPIYAAYNDQSNYVANIEPGQEISFPDIHLVRYGSHGYWWWQWMSLPDGIACAANVFGSIVKNQVCSRTIQNYAPMFGGWTNCASEGNGNKCVLPSSTAPYWVSFGNPTGNMVINQFEGDSVECVAASFGWHGVETSGAGVCRIAAFENQFWNNTGAWQQVSSANQKVDITLKQGISSTAISSMSGTLSVAVSKSYSKGMSFAFEGLGGSASTTLSHNVSASVTQTMSTALAQTVSESCTVSCPAPNKQHSQTTVWQWLVASDTLGSFGATDTMSAFSCAYWCQQGTARPQCPPNFCKNAQCSECANMN
jgi:hypothetical protein